jgi:ADP-heptose:LPS heptosyltransferase
MLTLTRKIEKILIIQLGDIGDVVWTTPTLWAVKGAYPDTQVSVLVKEGYGALLEDDPSLDKVFEVPGNEGGFLRRRWEQIRFLWILRREGFSWVLDLRASDRGAFIACLTGAPMRVSLLYRDGVPFWRNRVFTHLIDPPATTGRVRGAAEQSLRIVRELGMASCDTIPKLWISEEVKKQAQEILQREKIINQSCWITVSPFSRWAYKEWGYEKWVKILDWLWDEYKIAAVIVGAAAEREKAGLIVKKCQGVAFNLAGGTSLSELRGLLSMSFLHLGVDSGSAHIAAATGAPTITIYGPSDWYDWAPVGDKHKVVLPDGECVPCRKKGCDNQGWSRCLDDLTAEQVQRVIGETLKGLNLHSGIPWP